MLDNRQNDNEGEQSEAEDSISFEHDAGEMEELESLPTVSCYFECIFGLKEMYLYRGIISAYLLKYADAISDFQKLQFPGQVIDSFSKSQSLAQLSLSVQSDNESVDAQQQASKNEIQYNILVCQLLSNDMPGAQKSLD